MWYNINVSPKGIPYFSEVCNNFKPRIVAEREMFMFNEPIKHVRLRDINDLYKFSYLTDRRATPMTKWDANGHIAYCDSHGAVLVTPYRSEINGILKSMGYRDKYMRVPFSNGEKRPEAYKWLCKIATEENWAETFEIAFKKAVEKGVKTLCDFEQKIQIKEIERFQDAETNNTYLAMTRMFLPRESRENVGTYIVVNDRTLVICDEYGRTFLVKTKRVINEMVNQLIEAGYTRTVHPEKYVIPNPEV